MELLTLEDPPRNCPFYNDSQSQHTRGAVTLRNVHTPYNAQTGRLNMHWHTQRYTTTHKVVTAWFCKIIEVVPVQVTLSPITPLFQPAVADQDSPA